MHDNWLRVLGTAECPEIGQGVRHHLHAMVSLVSLLDVCKTAQQPLDFVLPHKGPLNAPA